MEILYNVAINAYVILLKIAALFNRKAGAWVEGRKNWHTRLKKLLPENEKRIWFHCSSLGEFEQGKPVLDKLRTEYPQYKILLTFFSPSGYEQKKNDPVADYVFYLPADGILASKKFIEIVKPQFVIIVKYEFWHFYIKELWKRKIPCFVISATFRKSQIYFKYYGRFFYNILQRITHIFVQNQTSLELLYDNKLINVTVSGDTRFDRVYIKNRQTKSLPLIKHFKNNSKIFIAGSTWPADEKLLTALINKDESARLYIIAPHEINNRNIEHLQKQLIVNSIKYSELSEQNANSCKVLIIDNIGLLSSLYAYADVAYIGGGFGAGIHNTLEAAAFGLPVIFGPSYKKFNEAIYMVKQHTAFSITNYDELKNNANSLMTDAEQTSIIKGKNLKYIESGKGATDVIINYLKMNCPA
jgi:3-deoxy-D-manno-octulosonic-acid transferase